MKYIAPLGTLINSSTLSNLIRYGFVPIKVLYEMLQIKIFSYKFSFDKILTKPKSSILIMTLIITSTIFNINFF